MNALGNAWMGIDIGTQSVRAIAADDEGTVLATAAQPLRSSQRKGREHTQDPEEWWGAVCACCRQITATIPAGSLQGLAIDATSGTILLTDAENRPATEALMYDDGRAEGNETLWADFDYRIQPSWALPKLRWLLHHHAGGTIGLTLTHQNDFIQNRLAGCKLSTDWSNSLKSGYDLQHNQWPHAIFDKLGLPEKLFPAVVAPGSLLGHVSPEAAAETGLPAGLPIFGGMTDGCAAQLAAAPVESGNWNSVLGTTLVLKGVTETRLHDPLGVVYSHRLPDGRWLPGGASSTGAGSIAQHFQPDDLDWLAAASTTRGPSTTVVYPLHATGERFPFAAPSAEAFELDPPRDDVDRYRAVLQGVAFVERLSFDYLQLLGAPLTGAISVSGGAVRSALWNQIRADVLGRTLTIPAVTEAAFGMAVLASSHRSSLKEASAHMVALGSPVDPALPFAETYGEGYTRLLHELEARGWLPSELAAYSLRQLNR